ncbi:hypothetical protein [Aeromonas media]|uniref:hypothetical protein n=1 Tax=Aeromonas media TaxID=651 RepID=UPI003D25C15B
MEIVSFKCSSTGVSYTIKSFTKSDFEEIASSVPVLAPIFKVMDESSKLSVTTNSKTEDEVINSTSHCMILFYYLKEGLIEEGKELLRKLQGVLKI